MRQNPAQYIGFSTIRHAAEAFCFYAVVGIIAVAVGFVAAVLVLTSPSRSKLAFAPLPAVSWETGR